MGQKGAPCPAPQGAVAMGRRPGSILANADALHAGPTGTGRDGATVNLWVEAKRIWLAGSCQQGS